MHLSREFWLLPSNDWGRGREWGPVVLRTVFLGVYLRFITNFLYQWKQHYEWGIDVDEKTFPIQCSTDLKYMTQTRPCPTCPSNWKFVVNALISLFRPNTEKYGPRKTPYLDTFHTVIVVKFLIISSLWSHFISAK